MNRAVVLTALAALASPLPAYAQGRGAGRGGGSGGGASGGGAQGARAGAVDAGEQGIHHSEAGSFEVWLPPVWIARASGKRITAENRPGTIGALIGPLGDPDADLADDDVVDFIDDELDDLKVTSDSSTPMGGVSARTIEGSGTDDGDPVAFRAVAIDPGGSAAILVALVYGDPDVMAQDNLKAATLHIFRSLHAA